jgi:hypothetical protein
MLRSSDEKENKAKESKEKGALRIVVAPHSQPVITFEPAGKEPTAFWRQKSLKEEYYRLDLELPSISSSDNLNIHLHGEALKRGTHYTQVEGRVTIVSLHGIPIFQRLLAIVSEIHYLLGPPSKPYLDKPLCFTLPLAVNSHKVHLRFEFSGLKKIQQYLFLLPHSPPEASNASSLESQAQQPWSKKEHKKFVYNLRLYFAEMFDLSPSAMEKRTLFLLKHSTSRLEFLKALVKDARAQIADYFDMVLTCEKEGKEFEASRWIALENAREQYRRNNSDKGESSEEESSEENNVKEEDATKDKEMKNARSTLRMIKIMQDFSDKFKRKSSSNNGASEEKSEVVSVASVAPAVARDPIPAAPVPIAAVPSSEIPVPAPEASAPIVEAQVSALEVDMSQLSLKQKEEPSASEAEVLSLDVNMSRLSLTRR